MMIASISTLADLATADVLQTSWAFMQKGGIFMIPLAITAIAGTSAILYKFLSLARNRVVPDTLARQVLNFHDLETKGLAGPLLQTFENGQSALARLAAVVVRHKGKPHRDITTAVEAASREETAHLHAGIGVLDTAITIAPLLGLLGTASGLVTIFQGLSESADHLTIARGIAEALTTTIFGLAIAVPCVVAHGFFTRRIEVLTVRLESLLADLAYVCQQTAPKS